MGGSREMDVQSRCRRSGRVGFLLQNPYLGERRYGASLDTASQVSIS